MPFVHTPVNRQVTQNASCTNQQQQDSVFFVCLFVFFSLNFISTCLVSAVTLEGIALWETVGEVD